MSKFEDRKRVILEAMRVLDRPIWAGDVAPRISDQEQFRAAFLALLDEGAIERRPGAKGARTYYRLAK